MKRKGCNMRLLSGLLRRLLGGWLSTKAIISERAVQWIIGLVLYGAAVAIKINFLGGYHTFLYSFLNVWVFGILGVVAIVICLTTGHFPGFQCGTEDQRYIDEQLAKGREIKFQKIVDWLGNRRGFEQFGKEWCFWQLLLCKTSACLLPALFFGYHFIVVGALVAFAYNAMFWVQLKPYKNILTSPTNWGEFWQGWFVMSALL